MDKFKLADGYLELFKEIYTVIFDELEAENERLKEINVQFEFALKLLVEELNALKEERQ